MYKILDVFKNISDNKTSPTPLWNTYVNIFKVGGILVEPVWNFCGTSGIKSNWDFACMRIWRVCGRGYWQSIWSNNYVL